MSQVLVKKAVGSILVIGIIFITIAMFAPRMFSVPHARALTEEEQQMVEVDNAFGFKLFNQISDGEDGNVFISPLSVSMVLGMALNGADGDTKEAILDALELSGLTEEQINQSYQSLIQLLKSLDRDVTLELANSVWCNEESNIKQDYIDASQTYFDAQVTELDLDDPATPGVINNWVRNKTRGKIDEIAGGFDELDVAAVLNAIYFEGVWQSQFKPESTRDGTFYLADGSEKPCRMMYQKEDFKYSYNEYFEAIDLPYGNGRYSMTILLPHNEQELQRPDIVGWTVDDIVANFTPQNWEKWIGDLHEVEKAINLPRFSLDYELNLIDTLTALGMGVAFDRYGANFTRMADPGTRAGLYISDFTHKTVLEVDEKGTRAAAVTLATFTSRAGRSMPMTVDHPFVLIIREQHTNSILFMGKIMDPDFGL